MSEKRKCIDCGRTLGERVKIKLCPNCSSRNYWIVEYKKFKEEVDRKFKLYDITIKSLMDKLRKYEPIVEELDN